MGLLEFQLWIDHGVCNGPEQRQCLVISLQLEEVNRALCSD